MLDNRILSDVRGTITIDTTTGGIEGPQDRIEGIGELIKSYRNVHRGVRKGAEGKILMANESTVNPQN